MSATLAPEFLVVRQNVARNPVAQAIARDRIKRATTAFRIQLHTLAEGENVESHVYAARQVLAVAAEVCARAGQDAESITEALRTCHEISATGYRWHPRWTAPLNVGMADALDVYAQAKAAELQRAYVAVMGGA